MFPLSGIITTAPAGCREITTGSAPEQSMKTNLISVGTAKFARNAAALTESLFDPSGTACGFFKVRKHSVLFSLPNGEPFACLVANPGQSRFFVSATKQSPAGRIWYSYGLTDAAALRLGLSHLRYSQQSDEADRVWLALSQPATT